MAPKKTSVKKPIAKKMPVTKTTTKKAPAKKRPKANPVLLKPGHIMTEAKLKKLQLPNGDVTVILAYPLNFFLETNTYENIQRDCWAMLRPPGYVIKDNVVDVQLYRADTKGNVHLRITCNLEQKTVPCIVENNDTAIPATERPEENPPLHPNEIRRSYQTEIPVTETTTEDNTPVVTEPALKVSARFDADDNSYNFDFDATQWFVDAEEDDLLDLAEEDWKNCATADSIAMQLEDSIPELGEALEAGREKENDPTADAGYEITVNKEEALAWLEKNKPEIFAKLNGALAS